MSCVAEYPICITKGTSFEQVVQFTTAFTEVIENPTDYRGVFVFRDYQAEAAPVYLSLTAPIDTTDPDAPAQIIFTASSVQTLLLPDWDVVAYCNLEQISTSDPTRLFNSEVKVSQ